MALALCWGLQIVTVYSFTILGARNLKSRNKWVCLLRSSRGFFLPHKAQGVEASFASGYVVAVFKPSSAPV